MDFWDVFWLLAIWIPLVFLWVFALVDLFLSDSSGVLKMLWVGAIILLPVVGTILYFATQPSWGSGYLITSPDEKDPEADTDVARLADLNKRGLISDADFAKAVTAIYR